MTCNACGEKPKNTAKDFTKAVIEINNPETLVLLRKVVIPASMGTEERVPPAIGKYHNVILYYEANKHVYLYSSDGIPTMIESEVPQDLIDRVANLEDDVEDLQEEFDEFKNSPDVVDIVATYADLEAYDTSDLGDKDVIRVLADETHDGASAYYRWDKDTSQWGFIGITGPYYTKSEIDTIVQSIDGDIDDLQSEIGKAKILTQEDYNYPADNPNSIALWLLDPGMYVVSQGVSAKVSNDSVAEDTLYIVTTLGTYGKAILNFTAHNAEQTGPYYGTIYTVTSTGAEFDNRPLNSVIDALDSTYTKRALSANQGRVLNEKIGDLTTLTTTDKTNAVAAINELNSSLPTVVQSRGNSTTDVMSQAATTSLVYADIRPSYYGSLIRIGYDASNTSGISNEGIAIGTHSKTTGNYGIALGTYAWVEAVNGIAIGGETGTGEAPRIRAAHSIAIGDHIDIENSASYSVAVGAGYGATGRSILAKGSVSLGAFSKATSNGEMNIGLSEATAAQQATYGYNGSEYRLLSGLYDPQSSHDAATKGYCDNAIINGGTTAPTTATIGAVGTQYTYVDTSGTPTAHLCVCVAVDTSVTPNTYTWQTLI